MILEPVAGRGRADPAGEVHLAQAPGRAGGGEGGVLHRCVSLLRSYSRLSRTVSRRPRAMRGERAAQVAEAAVEGRAGAEAACRRATRTGHCVAAAQSERSRACKSAEGPGQIDAGVDHRLQRDAVAVPGGRGCRSRRAGRQGSSRRRPARPATAAGRRWRAARGRTRVAMREAWLRSTMPAKAPMLPRRASKAGRRRIRSRSRSCRRSSRSARGRPRRRRRRAAAASASSRMVTRSGSEIGRCIARRLGHRCR